MKILIKNGRILNPATNMDEIADLLIVDGKVESIEKEIETEVCIIGAGIAGIVTAYELTKQGKKVVLVDKGRCTMGVTANTTAKITSQHGLFYKYLIETFGIEDAKKYGKGIFILVKTSNKSSGELQDLKLEDGKTVYEKVAELVNSWGEDLIGEYGYSSVASVVGATYPVQMENLRKIMPHSYFLIPGYGAQGGKAEDLAVGFENGLGGIVNASRSLMCAFKADRWKDQYSDSEYAQATRAEAIRMRDELNAVIK